MAKRRTAFTVAQLRRWLKGTWRGAKRRNFLVAAFFVRYQTLPGLNEKLMLDGVPDADSPEATGYVHLVFEGLLNGLYHIYGNDETADVSDTLISIYDSIPDEDGDEAQLELWDATEACDIIGQTLKALGQPHVHPSSTTRINWCVRTNRPTVFRLIAACKILLISILSEPS